MDFGLLVFLGVSGLSFFHCRNLTVGMIKTIGINSRYYPKKYIVPKKWMKKLFKIEQKMIPRCFYCEFFIAIILAIIEPINLVVYFYIGNYNVDGNNFFAMILLFHVCLIIANTIYILIISSIIKRAK